MNFLEVDIYTLYMIITYFFHALHFVQNQEAQLIKVLTHRHRFDCSRLEAYNELFMEKEDILP